MEVVQGLNRWWAGRRERCESAASGAWRCQYVAATACAPHLNPSSSGWSSSTSDAARPAGSQVMQRFSIELTMAAALQQEEAELPAPTAAAATNNPSDTWHRLSPHFLLILLVAAVAVCQGCPRAEDLLRSGPPGRHCPCIQRAERFVQPLLQVGHCF